MIFRFLLLCFLCFNSTSQTYGASPETDSDASRLKESLVHFPLKGSLLGWNGTGGGYRLDYHRNSPAWTGEGVEVAIGEPRWRPGGIWMEPAVNGIGRNRLPSSVAAPTSKGFSSISGKVRFENMEGGEADRTLLVEGEAQMTSVPFRASSRYPFPFQLELRGEGEMRVILQQDGELVDEMDISAAPGQWQTRQLMLKTQGASHSKAAFELVLESSVGASLQIRRMQLEALPWQAGQAGRSLASSWIGGGIERMPDFLKLPGALRFNEERGTLAWQFVADNTLKVRTLVSIGDVSPERSPLRVDLVDDREVSLQVAGKSVGAAAIDPEKLRSEGLSFQLNLADNFVVLWVEGTAPIKAELSGQRALSAETIWLGGFPISRKGSFFSDGIFSDVWFSREPLQPEQLNALRTDYGTHPSGEMAIDREPISVFCRDEVERNWPAEVILSGDAPAGAELALIVNNGLGEWKAPARNGRMSIPWSPAMLEVGTYSMRLELRRHGKVVARSERAIEIVPARVGAFPVMAWQGSDAKLARAGINVGGLLKRDLGELTPGMIETRNRAGLYTLVLSDLVGNGREEGDFLRGFDGSTGLPDQRAETPARSLAKKVQLIGDIVSLYPDIRYFLPNTERQWHWRGDFRPSTIEEVKARFGIDLARYQNKKGIQPYGRLNPANLLKRPSANGRPVIPDDDPFYRYHLWWFRDGPGTEAHAHDALAVALRNSAPWVKVVSEPVLRRPAIAPFREQGLLQHWFYFEWPFEAVMVQEMLSAAARGTPSEISGMPQFLFKSGQAAPYPALPTADLFRLTTGFCLSRPLQALTLWNVDTVILGEGYHKTMSPQAFKERLGDATSWTEIAEQIKENKETFSGTIYDPPGLREGVSQLLCEKVRPLGPLLAELENRPRRVALYVSLAGQIYGSQAWVNRITGLQRALLQSGVPFDVLFDADFEQSGDPLSAYRLVLLNDALMTETAWNALTAFAKKGGRVAGSSNSAASRFPNAEVLTLPNPQKRPTGHTPFADQPLAIEAMEASELEATADKDGSLRLILASLDPEVQVTKGEVSYNLMQAEGANYLALVNQRMVPGEHFGPFGKVLEKGERQEVVTKVAPSLGSVCYRLDSAGGAANVLPLENGLLTVSLDPADTGLFVILPEAIDRMELELDRETAIGGTLVTAKVRLMGVSGKAVPGLLPVEIQWTDADGKRLEQSGYGLLRNGSWEGHFSVAFNAKPGMYQVQVRDLASGLRMEKSFRVAGKEKGE